MIAPGMMACGSVCGTNGSFVLEESHRQNPNPKGGSANKWGYVLKCMVILPKCTVRW
jgi:hypothetical protein